MAGSFKGVPKELRVILMALVSARTLSKSPIMAAVSPPSLSTYWVKSSIQYLTREDLMISISTSSMTLRTSPTALEDSWRNIAKYGPTGVSTRTVW